MYTSKARCWKLPSFCTIKPHVILCLLGWILPKSIGKWTLKTNWFMSAQIQRRLFPSTIFVTVYWLQEISEISVRCCNDGANFRLSTIHFHCFPVSKCMKNGWMNRIFKLLRFLFYKLPKEMCNLTFHNGVTTLRRSIDEVFDKQKIHLKNTQNKETKALIVIFSCLLF